MGTPSQNWSTLAANLKKKTALVRLLQTIGKSRKNIGTMLRIKWSLVYVSSMQLT